MAQTIVALDAMGGDYGPSVVIPAAVKALERHPALSLILVGDEAIIQAQLTQLGAVLHPRLSIHSTTQVVAMDEQPALALRNKKDSSMRVAINLVKEEKAHACVSAGNTGALMATARFVLKTLPGVDRPAIITAFPTTKPKTVVRMLDLGANVEATPESLVEFAVMGSVMAQSIGKIDKPKVGLLNIGSEAIKGNELVKATAKLLEEQAGINYIGYVEGDMIFSGEVDVVVSDGFVGNIALKASEGSAQLILHHLKAAFYKNIFTKILALLFKPILMDLKKNIDPANYNGASLVGLKGIVVKSHGGAKIPAFANAISEAVSLAAQDVPRKIEAQVAQLLNTQELS